MRSMRKSIPDRDILPAMCIRKERMKASKAHNV